MIRVLLIDRYPALFHYLKDFLERRRPEFRLIGQAVSGEEGVELAKAKEPDVILVEPVLFGCSAQAVAGGLNRLNRASPGVKLIVITGVSRQSYPVLALRAGAVDFLLKPLDPQELLAALDRCIDADETALLSEPLPELEGRRSENIVQLIHQGKGEEALRLLRECYPAQEKADFSYSGLSVEYIKIAIAVIRLPDGVSSVPEPLVSAYQDLVHLIFRSESRSKMNQAMEQFVVCSAEIFDRCTVDQGFRLVETARRYVEEHLAAQLSLELLASILYISPTHFSRVFKSKVGQTFSSYLAGRRMERAKILLRTSSMPVAEVALQTGYADPNSFTRRFKGQTGLTPSQYRRQQSRSLPMTEQENHA